MSTEPHYPPTRSTTRSITTEGELAVDLYSNYFGPSSFKRVAITQQTSCNYGQSWPELVYIPMCYFFDTTVRHELGMDFGDRGYWKIVAPHDVAHQWWGHTVGFNSSDGDTLPTPGSHLGAEVALGNMSTTPPIKKALAKNQSILLSPVAFMSGVMCFSTMALKSSVLAALPQAHAAPLRVQRGIQDKAPVANEDASRSLSLGRERGSR